MFQREIFINKKDKSAKMPNPCLSCCSIGRARRDSNPRQTWYRKPPLYPTELRAHIDIFSLRDDNVSITHYTVFQPK